MTFELAKIVRKFAPFAVFRDRPPLIPRLLAALSRAALVGVVFVLLLLRVNVILYEVMVTLSASAMTPNTPPTPALRPAGRQRPPPQKQNPTYPFYVDTTIETGKKRKCNLTRVRE